MNFARDLAIILISAGIFTIICKALKQPSILGYIIAGFLISPNLGLFGISSMSAVKQWSDIGIIFLMFGLGLEFSFKKLLAVGSSALVTAGSKFIGVFVIGFLVGQAMSWSMMECIFLGGLLSMSSTVVVIKSYGEMDLMRKPWAGAVFGTLVVEDLIAILLMVLLSTLAVSNNFSGGELLLNLAKLVFFLLLWFVVGIYLIPTILKKTRRYINEEILLIVCLGLCFGMVTLATSSGFSSALGAFMMGSILSETIENEHVSKLITPIKDLFGAVFFVSVGMMISPEVIASHWVVILILAAVVVLTHILFVAMGIILSGGGLENAVNAGFSLAQLGEFGFIIASVGVTLGVMREFIYPVIIAVSVITIFTTPYYIKFAPKAYELLRGRLPENVLDRIDRPDQGTRRSAAERSEWREVITAWIIRVLIYGVILTAILLLSVRFLPSFIGKILPGASTSVQNLVNVAVTLFMMLPFLYGIGVSTGSAKSSTIKLIKEKRGNILPVFGLMFARIFIAIGFILAAVSSHVNLAGWMVAAIFLAGVLLFIVARYYFRRFDAMEERFMINLNEKEEAARRRSPVRTTVQDSMAGYDVHIEELVLSPDSMYVGQRLMDLPLRSESGANIIKVTRGSRKIVIPGGDERVYPFDRLLAVGTSEQLSRLRELLASSVSLSENDSSDPNFKVVPVLLGPDSWLTGKQLRSVRLRDMGCMIISILRGDHFITNPKADLIFQAGDRVWIAGDTDSIDWLR